MTAVTVFPDSPLSALVRKGEVKARYYNPTDMFDRVQVVSPSDEEIDPSQIASMAGAARMSYHPQGWTARFSARQALRMRRFLDAELDRLVPAVAAFRPDVIRGYGPQIPAWFAVHCARRLGVPAVVSLHADYDRDVRGLLLRDRNIRLLVAHTILGLTVERDVIPHADAVICVYRFAARYAERRRARKISVIYNRVDTERFSPRPRAGDPTFTILCISRFDMDTDPSNLVRAMEHVAGRLRLIGHGPLGPQLHRLAERSGAAERIEFIDSVPHAAIHEQFRMADVYACAHRHGGVAIPLLEAMASGLPVVATSSPWEPAPEIVEEVGIVVENDRRALGDALERLRLDPDLRARLAKAGRERILPIDGKRMERAEADLYSELIREGVSAEV